INSAWRFRDADDGAVQLVEYFYRIDFLPESTLVLLTLSSVHLLAPPRVRKKRKGCKPQPAPFVHFILRLAVFEDGLNHLYAGVILQHESDAACGTFHSLPIKLVRARRWSVGLEI